MQVYEHIEAVKLERAEVLVYTIPVSSPESDGTIEWNKTTMVLVRLRAGGKEGIGYTYAHKSCLEVIQDLLLPQLEKVNLLDIPAIWMKMVRVCRNAGRPGIASMAISAVDNALWDLKAKILEQPLANLLGKSRDKIKIYGSGGFTSYSLTQLVEQLTGWAAEGIDLVKMKIGREPDQDLKRVKEVVHALQDKASLFVDANGAYTRKQATGMMNQFGCFGVKWFEEPVSSDDLEGLKYLTSNAPGDMEIAAGEYGFDSDYFRRMLEQQAVDVLQADATRCAGITGFLKASVLAETFHVPFSSHCAPYQHLHACCAATTFVHAEYFYDHARIEQLFFDGANAPVDGYLIPDLSRPGIGLELKEKDAKKYLVN